MFGFSNKKNKLKQYQSEIIKIYQLIEDQPNELIMNAERDFLTIKEAKEFLLWDLRDMAERDLNLSNDEITSDDKTLKVEYNILNVYSWMLETKSILS